MINTHPNGKIVSPSFPYGDPKGDACPQFFTEGYYIMLRTEKKHKKVTYFFSQSQENGDRQILDGALSF